MSGQEIMKALLGWPVLIVQALALVVLCWPWADHFVSYFWIMMLIAVLLAELHNKFFSPKKQTVSNNIRDESLNDPIRFWIMIGMWLLFSATLAGHFMVRLF